MKNVLVLFFFLLGNAASSQTLTVRDFERGLASGRLSGREFVQSKGFMLQDTLDVNSELDYATSSGAERLKIYSKQGSEGDLLFEVKYYLNSHKMYLRFIQSLKQSKFKYDKKMELYRISTSSYSFLQLKLVGEQLIDNKKCYLITYSDIQGKELSAPQIK